MRTRSRPTITDVARLAGVSPTTVSYVLSGPKERASRISKETSDRIFEVVEEIGYVPNLTARTLRLQRTDRVLFLVQRLTSLYSQAMANAIEQALAPHGRTLSVQIGSDPDQIRRAITLLDQKQADGLIVEASDIYPPELMVAAQNGHAIVAIGPGSSNAAFDVVVHQFEPALKDVIRHVVERNYHHFLLLSSFPDANVFGDRRISVAHEELRSFGFADTDVTVLHCPHNQRAAYQTALKLLPHIRHPVAVYAGADVSAIGVLWACLHLGLKVPEEVAIIGHGNSSETHITVPPITSLGPTGDGALQAVGLMSSRLEDRSLPVRQIVQPWKLYTRGST